MTFRVRVVHPGLPHAERVVCLSLLVHPGVYIRAGNERRRSTEGKATAFGLTSVELDQAVDDIRGQARRNWRRFTLPVRGRGDVTYRFELRIDAAADKTPVCNIAPSGSLEMVDDLRDHPHARRATELIGAAERLGYDNVAIVHPRLSEDPNARFMSSGGVFRRLTCGGPLMERTSNVVRLGFQQIHDGDNQTAAHEIGHLFGLGHGRADGVPREDFPLMLSSDTGRRFQLTDQVNLHRAAQDSRAEQGVHWSTPPQVLEWQPPSRTRAGRGARGRPRR